MSNLSYGTPGQLSAAQMYRTNQINSAGPLDLLLMAYDAALVGCGQRDLGRTTAALSVLRNALDFSYDVEIALGLFRLYQYCAELARNGDYEQAAHLLRELRQTWAQVKAQLEHEAAEVVPVNMRPAVGAPPTGGPGGLQAPAATPLRAPGMTDSGGALHGTQSLSAVHTMASTA